MWLLPLARASGSGGPICLKPVMILFCLVLKATLSVKGYIFDTKYILSLVRTFDCLCHASLSDAAGSCGRVFLEPGI